MAVKEFNAKTDLLQISSSYGELGASLMDIASAVSEFQDVVKIEEKGEFAQIFWSVKTNVDDSEANISVKLSAEEYISATFVIYTTVYAAVKFIGPEAVAFAKERCCTSTLDVEAFLEECKKKTSGVDFIY